jgi:hypothetical protein
MPKEKANYLANRTEAFLKKGIEPDDKRFNCHHILSKFDKKLGRLPPDYDIDQVDNLLPILIERHDALNHFMEQHHELYEDISNRQDLAHLAEIGQLDHYDLIKARKH